MEGISLISPSSDVGYFDIEIPEQLDSMYAKVDALVNIFRAIKMADMTDDLIRRFRPYCINFKQFDEVCEQRWKSLQVLLTNHGASYRLLKKWVKETNEIFSKLAPSANEHSLPLVLYIGEIYTRQHDPYANYVIQRIEEERLEVIRGSIAEWLEYVIYITNRRTPNFILGFAEKYMSFVDWRFKKIFGSHLQKRHVVPKPQKIIEDMQESRRYHGDIMGESPLVIGTFLKFLNDELKNNYQKVSGIFHVGPFTCMQEGVAMAKIDAIIKEELKHNPALVVPIIHAFLENLQIPILKLK